MAKTNVPKKRTRNVTATRGQGNFKKIENNAKQEGYSSKSAEAIAASVGIKNLGQAEMTKRAQQGKKKKK
jgi:hypothetical protein